MKKAGSGLDHELKPRYITDSSGNRVEVILNIKTYEKILEHIEDFCLGIMAEEVDKTETKTSKLESVRSRLLKNDHKK